MDIMETMDAKKKNNDDRANLLEEYMNSVAEFANIGARFNLSTKADIEAFNLFAMEHRLRYHPSGTIDPDLKEEEIVHLRKLGKCFGLKIRNAVDRSELAADVLHEPRLCGFGLRKLASKVLLVPFEARSSSLRTIDWIMAVNPADDRIECTNN
ncbi:putative glycogenin [Corchorus capsularis]|uniref:Putative glycogenin n=1 Tax=Corchorus capsularis TaxID=210143 RepID=A0A1R3IPN7_COCAP|nr:putative glycogenin [Corchorus capsularis]